jgi:fucose permease
VIHTEQTKLLATAFNNLGVGAILAGVIVPTVNGTVADVAHIAAWVALGISLIAYAQVWLGRL